MKKIHIATFFLVFFPLIPACAASPPNVVVIMTDDQRDADPLDRMPHTKALIADQGIRFTDSLVVNPVCCAARASFLTGQYSHNDGVWDNKSGSRPGGFASFKGDDNTIACWTQAAGYRTALIGKYLNGYGHKASKHYIPPCWNFWWGLTTPFRYYDYEVNDNGSIKTFGLREKDYQEDVVSGLAQQFIAQSKQPFFLWITGVAPHAGYPGINVPVPPKRYKGYFRTLSLPRPPNFNETNFLDKPTFMQKNLPRMDRASVNLARSSYRLRAETLLSADDMVAAIISELQSLGMLDNTFVVFTSDNGFFNGEHRMPVGKHLMYEEALHVPLAIRGPGIPNGEDRTQTVNNLDLVATLVELTGAKANRVLDGKSLVPLFSSQTTKWRTAMLVEGADVLPESEATIYGYYAAVRTADYKYGEHVNEQEAPAGRELYDLATDPYEVRGRIGDPKFVDVVHELRPLLHSLETCAGDGCWFAGAVPHRVAGQTIKPEIGAACTICVQRNLSRSLEPAESGFAR